ncbi:uncharacterized protein LOC128385821 isoform X2 [Panonychus citri]|uniref:uncharacterized protein LOC128385821 isoform X2 n=1 Tax=Panonychus citri TaxID=50023 RepID=UPI002307F8E5|nr:uncharacterized protein LOC128385821 isoform X2 [Panonychus citri]
MSFTDLPDNCLWKIFENVNGVIDLIQFSKVENKVDYIDENSLWINHNTNWNDYNLFELFPNLKIIDIAVLLETASLLDIVRNNPRIKGLIAVWDYIDDDYILTNIEMIAAACEFDYEAVFYNGPNLSSLKILELGTSYFVEQFTGFHFMDFCPSLESAFFQCWAEDIYVNESIKNYNLRDLVIDNIHSGSFLWPLLKKLVSKFPNLHHLAIRNFDKLDDSKFHLDELIKLLPKLKLLDLRRFEKVTHKSADFLSKYCVKKNRSIVIYYDCENEPAEWPKLVNTRETICYGFDFMKHCFYKKFSSLPNLIDE